MVTASLFDEPTESFQTRGDLEKTLKKLYEREIRQQLHAITLSDYLRKRQIPKGLRIQKSPTIGRENEKFCDQWCQIMNKCSFDLMALLIQERSDQLKKTQEEIQPIRALLAEAYSDKDMLAKVEIELSQYKLEIEKELKTHKLKKFERDNEHYKNALVYNWRNPPQDAPPATTQEGNPDDVRAAPRPPAPRAYARYSDTSSFDTDSEFSDGVHNQDRFLDRREVHRGTSAPQRRGRGRGQKRGRNDRGGNAAGARGGWQYNHPPHYKTRSQNH